MDVDETLIQSFWDALDSPAPSGRQKEQVLQDFLEEHTEFIPTPNLLNHQLHFLSIISKFPLGTELKTDYAYISKSSDAWIITLVELESPDKELFTKNAKHAVATAQFNAALDQVRSWKEFIANNRDEVLRRLEPVLQPAQMQSNPIEFRYQLVAGRSANKNLTVARKTRFRRLQNETGVGIVTYDQLVDFYRNARRFKKNVLRMSGFQYEFKHMSAGVNQMLAYLTPGQLLLSDDQISQLKATGYDTDAWKRGERLSVNGMHPKSAATRIMAEMLVRPASGASEP